ncbi:internal virion protein D [Pseudomonas phage 10P302A]|uniref:Internal virion protein D n=1 Tax=Pseudomonas phage 10P302A TaxID=3038233 RepID=A0AAF0GJ73_9CAUD|nr:internal virion protein D [Pseudomonas phage 10P302A]
MAKKTYADVKAAGTPYDAMIREAADANGISYDYLHKKIFNESSFNPNAVSPTGPRGLGQFTRATGRAYGLVTDEDFFDPAKSIGASAKLTADLLKTYKGDYLKAALAYNQGNGRLGAPQLAALDRGDFTKIAPEGRQYMANLLDVAGDSPSRQWFDKPDAPKLTAEYQQATEGLSATPKVERGSLGQRSTMNMMTPGEIPQQEKSFREMELEQNPEREAWYHSTEAMKAALATSLPGQIYRNITVEDHDPIEWMQDTGDREWSNEDYENIRKEGVDPQYFGFIGDYTRYDKKKLPEAIALAKQNMQHDQTMRGAGWAAQLAAGGVSAAVDPLTYVPVPGTALRSFGARVAAQGAFSGGMAVAGEGIKEATTGIEGHYLGAAVGGAAIGGTMAAVLDKWIAKSLVQPGRVEMSDEQLEKVLAMHGDSAMPNQRVEMDDDMLASARPQKVEDEMDDEYLEKILGLHGERSHKQEGRMEVSDDTVEGILARHMESSQPNEFMGPSIRLQAREQARQAGADDPTVSPWKTDEMPDEAFGVDYVDHPSEPGAVRLRDGSILSASNPLNPKTLKAIAELEPERSAAGFRFGGLTEIGLTLLRSEDEELRGIGAQLFRSPVGGESGSNGKFGAVAADVIERERGQDHVALNKMVEAQQEAMKDISVKTRPGGRQAQREYVDRRVAEAIEDPTGVKMGKLTEAERNYAKVVEEHFIRKEESLENPAMYGNMDAVSIMPHTRHSGRYIPNIYDDAIKLLQLKRFGGVEGLQKAIVESWMASYLSRPAVRARVDKMIKESLEKNGKVATPQDMKNAVVEYAHNKAFGIAGSTDFNRSSLIDDNLEGLVGQEANNFLEGRHLFDSDMAIQLSDGTTFAVNDLRTFDIPQITSSYNRRVNGDIGIMAATGKDTKALKDAILKIKSKNGNTMEVEALQESIKLLTGRSRRKPDDAFATLARGLTDISFVTKNAYMGVQNLTEVAGMITKGHTRMLMKGIPFLREMTTWGTKIKPEQLKDMHDMIFGRELDDLIRPRRDDIVQRLRNQGYSKVTSQAVGTFKFATGEAAARSPFTKFLTETSNYIMDAGRQGALVDLVNHALSGKTSKLFTKERLHSMSITEAQFGDMRNALKEHLVADPKGGFKIRDRAKFQQDPRVMDIWRLGDKVADETVLRPHKLSNSDSIAQNAWVKLAMQFKNFVFRSVNGRLIRGIYNSTKNSQGIDQAMQVGISLGMAASFYVAQRYVQAQGMPKEERRDFLKRSLDLNMVAYAALSRSSHVGSPLGIANFVAAPLGFDAAAAVRTSVLPRGPEYSDRNKAVKYSPLRSSGLQDFQSRLLEQVPGANVLGSIWQVGVNSAGLANDEGRSMDLQYRTGLYNGLRNLIPNDPVSQRALNALMQEQGMEYGKRGRN